MHDVTQSAQGEPLLDASHLGEEEFELINAPTFLADIATQRIEPPPFLFDSIFRSRTISMISAEPYTGKTLLMLAMMTSLDVKVPLFGRFMPSLGHRCAFFGQDAPTWDYHAQFLKLFYGLGLTPKEEESIPMPSMLFLNKGLSIVQPDFIGLIEQLATIYDVNVLFFDTLLEFHPFDENSNREMSRVMKVFKYIRDTFGMTVIFSHHLAKPTGGGSGGFATSANYRARGASVISGTCDHHIALSVQDKDKDGPLVRLEFAKGRGLSLRDNITAFTIASGLRPDGKETIILRPATSSGRDELLHFLQQRKTRVEIEQFLADKFKLSPAAARSRASRILSALKEEGLIYQKDHGVWCAS